MFGLPPNSIPNSKPIPRGLFRPGSSSPSFQTYTPPRLSLLVLRQEATTILVMLIPPPPIFFLLLAYFTTLV